MASSARRIGIRAARSQFGDLLQSVRQGAEWVITDRGRPIARLVPLEPAAMSLAERLRRLEEQGRISASTTGPATLPPPLPLPLDLAQDWLQEDRGR